GADVDRVQAGGGDDLVHLLDALGGLDHGDEEHLLVGVLLVVGAAVIDGAVAHHRHDDAVGARVQHLHDHRRLVPGHAHQRYNCGGRHGGQHRHHVRV